MSPCIIAIAGPSGSGKSLFASTIIDEVRREAPPLQPLLLREDAYYRDQGHLSREEREAVNYDHPDAMEHELLLEHLHALRAGETVEVPSYDFSQHTRCAEFQPMAPSPVIIVEGIQLLVDARLRDVFDMRFFMETPLDTCLLRRLDRDQRERGRSAASIIEQYRATVRPMYQQYIAPSAQYADMLITGGGRNRVALSLLRDMVLRKLMEADVENGL